MTVILITQSPVDAAMAPNSMSFMIQTSGDLPQGGDECLIKQQKAVLKPQNLPDNLPYLSANGLIEQEEVVLKP
jgi:hypothetical protein